MKVILIPKFKLGKAGQVICLRTTRQQRCQKGCIIPTVRRMFVVSRPARRPKKQPPARRRPLSLFADARSALRCMHRISIFVSITITKQAARSRCPTSIALLSTLTSSRSARPSRSKQPAHSAAHSDERHHERRPPTPTRRRPPSQRQGTSAYVNGERPHRPRYRPSHGASD